MGIIRVVRDPHNLSQSRIKGITSCAYRAGCENHLFDGIRTDAVPYWLPGGTAAHHVIDEIMTKSVVAGKVLTQDEFKDALRIGRGHLASVLSGKIPPRGYKDRPSRLKSIYWMPEEEKLSLSQSDFAKIVEERKWRYISQVMNGIEAVARRCMVPSPFARVQTSVGMETPVDLRSLRDPNVRIPMWWEIDILETNHEGKSIITDLKTGSFSYYLGEDLEGNRQMLTYWMGHKEVFGFEPSIAFFVSINIPKWDLQRHGAKVLELERYRAQARISFEEHFPEFHREVDDIWTCLSLLARPPRDAQESRERDSYEPLSALCKRIGIAEHVRQGRLIPNPGRQCAMCASKTQCRADNPEDWEAYESRQRLGNVVDPSPDIPEEWLDPFFEPPLIHENDTAPKRPAGPTQINLFGLGKSLERHNLKAKEWEALGFFHPKKLIGTLNKMVALIPPVNGEQCPCRKTGRIPGFFVEQVVKFFIERETHKCAQEACGKTRSGKGPQRVRDLYDSKVVCEILKDCPVEGCPHARKKDQPQQA